jgi:hypothetical protein
MAVTRGRPLVTPKYSLQYFNNLRGWGTWIRTKIDGVRVPISQLNFQRFFSKQRDKAQCCFSGLQTKFQLLVSASELRFGPA